MPPDPPQDWTWAVLAGGIPGTDDLENADKILKRWARSHGGHYDGLDVTLRAAVAGKRRAFFSELTGDAVDAETDPTSVMRHSDFPFWLELRERLAEAGIDHNSTRLVESFEEGPTGPTDFDAEEVGVLLTANGQLLEYRYSFERDAWDTWDDITDRWRASRHAEAIERALKQSS